MKNRVFVVVVLYKQTNLYYMFKLLIHLCLLHLSYAYLSDLKNVKHIILKHKKYNNFDILNIAYDDGNTKLYEIHDNVKLIYKQKLKNIVEVDYCKTGNAGVKIESTCHQLELGEQCPSNEPPDCDGRCNGSNNNCATMYGYATVWNGSTCADRCIKWKGTLENDFREYKTQMVTNNEICSLLKTLQLMTSDCCSETPNTCNTLDSVNECDQNPCNGHGTCTNLDNSYTCSCYNGYNGINCENVYSKNGCVATDYTFIKPMHDNYHHVNNNAGSQCSSGDKAIPTGTYTIEDDCTLTNQLLLSGNLEINGQTNDHTVINAPTNSGDTLHCKCRVTTGQTFFGDNCGLHSGNYNWCWINAVDTSATQCIGSVLSPIYNKANGHTHDNYFKPCTCGVDDVAVKSRHFKISDASHKLTLKWVKLTGSDISSYNDATGYGAVVRAGPGKLYMYNSIIIGNTATNGGFMHMGFNSICRIYDSSISGSATSGYGQDIFFIGDSNNSPDILIVNTALANNPNRIFQYFTDSGTSNQKTCNDSPCTVAPFTSTCTDRTSVNGMYRGVLCSSNTCALTESSTLPPNPSTC